jgi:PAS domain-containing protein
MNSKGVLMSRPYISGQKVLVSKSKSVYSEKERYKLAVVGGSKTFRDVVTANYPNMEIVEYETVNDCFRALYNEEVDLLMQNQYVVETLMAKPIYSTFSVLPVDGIGDELCFSTITQLNGGHGLRQEDCPVVISIINKSISQMSEIEMDNLVMRSMVEHQYEMELVDFLYSYRYFILTFLCVLIAVTILCTVHQRQKKHLRAIEEKEMRLKEFQQKRYQTIIDCSDDLIYEISVNGEASMGSDKIKEKFGWEIPTGSQKIDLKRAMEILHIYPDDETLFRQSHSTNVNGKLEDLTIRICKADGTPVWCRLSRTILVDKNNEPIFTFKEL